MTKTDKTGRWNNNRPVEKFQKPPQREKAREPDDMEVDNVNVRGDRRPRDNSNTRYFNCNEMGHIARRCKKPKRRISGQAPSRQSNIEVHDEEVTDEDVEYMTFGHYDASEAEEEIEPHSEKPLVVDTSLMIKSGVMNGKVVKILIDSGATNSLCRTGLGKHVIRSKSVRISGYDGTLSPTTMTREVKVTICFDFFTFKDTVMLEWDLKDKQFDVILGQPWFRQHNPVIDWRDQEVVALNGDPPPSQSKDSEIGWIMKICEVEPQITPRPPEIELLLDESKDVFPAQLPDGLPPERSVQFELTLKPGAKPQN
ncbi:hypothetical protein LEN26_017879, partial [Aphanomyces euteiches]